MSVLHNFECAAHGLFEQRVQPGVTPKCPKGCSSYFVKLVFLTPPNLGSERVRNATRLVREMADTQGLSDLDVSPSRPGDSVADRNFKKSGNPLRAVSGNFSTYMSALTHRENALTRVGFGHPYNAAEWRTIKETGKQRHAGAQPPLESAPPAEVRRSRD